MITNERIANNIRAERSRNNLTTEEVCKMLNVSRTTYSEYEKTADNLKISTLIKLSEIFKCEISNFFI